jgi:hypothetical protein
MESHHKVCGSSMAIHMSRNGLDTAPLTASSFSALRQNCGKPLPKRRQMV